jgi:putative PIN family toxin of toxin-antitoxin system
MLAVFEPFIDFIKIKSKVAICRDPKADFLLALAKDGNADYLITGDKDLLVINKYKQTVILTFKEFEEKFSE